MFKLITFASLLMCVLGNKNILDTKKHNKKMMTPLTVSGTFPTNPVYGYVVKYKDIDTCSGDYTYAATYLLNTCLSGNDGNVIYSCDEGGLKVTSFDEDSCTTNAGSNYMYPNDNCELDAVQPVCGELTSDPYKYMDKMSVQSFFNTADCSAEVVSAFAYVTECHRKDLMTYSKIEFPIEYLYDTSDCSGVSQESYEFSTTCAWSDDYYDPVAAETHSFYHLYTATQENQNVIFTTSFTLFPIRQPFSQANLNLLIKALAYFTDSQESQNEIVSSEFVFTQKYPKLVVTMKTSVMKDDYSNFDNSDTASLFSYLKDKVTGAFNNEAHLFINKLYTEITSIGEPDEIYLPMNVEGVNPTYANQLSIERIETSESSTDKSSDELSSAQVGYLAAFIPFGLLLLAPLIYYLVVCMNRKPSESEQEEIPKVNSV